MTSIKWFCKTITFCVSKEGITLAVDTASEKKYDITDVESE